MVGFIGLNWILQVAGWADHYHLDFPTLTYEPRGGRMNEAPAIGAVLHILLTLDEVALPEAG